MNRHTRNARFGASMMALAIASTFVTAAGTASADNPAGTSAPREPVQYRVKEKSLIGNDVHEAGATVSYAGLPSENLEPLCDEGRKRAVEYKESNAARVKQMIASTAGDSPVGDPAKFMEAFTKALAEERAEHQAQLAAQQETMAKMLEMQQTASIQLAEAAKNMATLAAAITAAPAAPVVAASAIGAVIQAQVDNQAPAADAAAKDTGTDAGAPAKRTRS
jgi:hypothetical protein